VQEIEQNIQTIESTDQNDSQRATLISRVRNAQNKRNKRTQQLEGHIRGTTPPLYEPPEGLVIKKRRRPSEVLRDEQQTIENIENMDENDQQRQKLIAKVRNDQAKRNSKTRTYVKHVRGTTPPLYEPPETRALSTEDRVKYWQQRMLSPLLQESKRKHEAALEQTERKEQQLKKAVPMSSEHRRLHKEVRDRRRNSQRRRLPDEQDYPAMPLTDAQSQSYTLGSFAPDTLGSSAPESTVKYHPDALEGSPEPQDQYTF
jgi:hypothetical protein